MKKYFLVLTLVLQITAVFGMHENHWYWLAVSSGKTIKKFTVNAFEKENNYEKIFRFHDCYVNNKADLGLSVSVELWDKKYFMGNVVQNELEYVRDLVKENALKSCSAVYNGAVYKANVSYNSDCYSVENYTHSSELFINSDLTLAIGPVTEFTWGEWSYVVYCLFAIYKNEKKKTLFLKPIALLRELDDLTIKKIVFMDDDKGIIVSTQDGEIVMIGPKKMVSMNVHKFANYYDCTINYN